MPKSLRPTHFIALPLGHNPAFRDRASALINAIYSVEPTPEGLHPSLKQPPIRMHLTIATLALQERETRHTSSQAQTEVSPRPAATGPSLQAEGAGTSRKPRWDPPTELAPLSDALRVLRRATASANDLLPPRQVTVEGGHTIAPLHVTLSHLDRFPQQCLPTKTRVLYAAPDSGDAEYDDVVRYCNTIIDVLREEGLLADNRPLTLHTTLINSSKRSVDGKAKKGRSRRIPLLTFDSSSAFRTDAQGGDELAALIEGGLGRWGFEHVELCRMGSYNDEGGYVVLGREDILRPTADV